MRKYGHVLITCPQHGHIILKGPQITLYSDKGSLFPPFELQEHLFLQVVSDNWLPFFIQRSLHPPENSPWCKAGGKEVR